MYTNDEWIAHTNLFGDMQSVSEHLRGTAEKAAEYAGKFGCGKAGYLCGAFHDLGKYSAEFQNRIRNPQHSARVDHSTAGAEKLLECSAAYTPVAMAIAGHHSGLPDSGNRRISTAGDGSFYGRLKTKIPDYGNWEKNQSLYDFFRGLEAGGNSCFPAFCQESRFSMAFFIRMIYSCLVDADYLDTEEFMNRGAAKRGGYESISMLLERFREYISPWLEETRDLESICGIRTGILQECMRQGKTLPQGLYTLTVPTGGGKTTASMGFALEHAAVHGMERVIYVIPYTSVIDQNAAVFEKILGEENVVEHHGGIVYELEEEECSDLAYKKALAVENWDAPVIVTTAVQFFESLFANKSSKCRKLHNIADSVIIFDEAQTLPLSYLEPCIAAIAQLVKNYRATVVLCTATQPALEKHFQKYIPDLRISELCSKTEELFRIFERTTIRDIGCQTVEQLAEELRGKRQVLCIVNKRKTAQELYRSFTEEGTYCLTTLLYPADRLKKFEEIRDRLKQDCPCRVIATSLIEAGVDLDFPLVFRQEAGLDSLIQSAGRCNREGRRSRENSYVYSFRLENENSAYAAQGIAAMKETWRRYEQIDALAAISFYFQFYRDLLGRENLDQKGILKAWEQGLGGSAYPFSSVASMFRLIENDTRQIFIPAEGTEELLAKVQEGTADKNTYRKLGRYGVNVYPEHFRALWESGCLEAVGDRIFVLRDKSQYWEDTGLQMDVETGFGIFI